MSFKPSLKGTEMGSLDAEAIGYVSERSQRNVSSRRWSFLVNSVSASPLFTLTARRRILLTAGFDVGEARIYPGCYFHTADLSLGSGALLNYGVHVDNVARVEVGAATAVGIHSTLLTSNHRIAGPRTRAGGFTWKPVSIGAGCWLGARVTVLPGVTIGDGCVIAAGAVVTSDCEPHGLYAGVPASRKRTLPLD